MAEERPLFGLIKQIEEDALAREVISPVFQSENFVSQSL